MQFSCSSSKLPKQQTMIDFTFSYVQYTFFSSARKKKYILQLIWSISMVKICLQKINHSSSYNRSAL